MAEQPFKKPRVRLHGDSEVAQQYLGSAYNLLHRVELFTKSAGAPVFATTQKLDDGTTVYAGVFGQERVVQVWPSGVEVGGDDDIRERFNAAIAALVWLPTGFMVTLPTGRMPQRIISPVPRNNYPEYVYEFNGGSAGFQYDGLFYDRPIKRWDVNNTSYTKVIGINPGNLQEDVRLTPKLMSDSEVSIAGLNWVAHAPEEIPLDELYSGDTLTFATQLLSSIARDDVMGPVRGVHTAALARWISGEYGSDLFEVQRTAGVPVYEAFVVQTGSPSVAANALANNINNLAEYEESSGLTWVLDMARSGGSYYVLAAAARFVDAIANDNTTTHGTACTLTVPVSRAAAITLSNLNAQDHSSVYIRGRRLVLMFYLQLGQPILTAALVGNGELGVVAYETSGSTKTLHYDLWILDGSAEPKMSSSTPIPSNSCAITSPCFSASGERFAMILWEEVYHPNQYLDPNMIDFNARRTYELPSRGSRSRIVTFHAGAWVVGEAVEVIAEVEAHSLTRNMNGIPEEQFWVPVTGGATLEEREELDSIGFFDSSNWRVRVNTYNYTCVGSLPTAVAYDGERLVVAQLNTDIRIRTKSFQSMWHGLVGRLTLDIAEENYKNYFNARLLRYRGSFPLDQAPPENTPEIERNTREFRFEQSITANGKTLQVAYAELSDTEWDDGVHGINSVFNNQPVLLPGAQVKYFAHCNIINLDESSYVMYEPMGDFTVDDVKGTWHIKGQPDRIDENQMAGVEFVGLNTKFLANVRVGRLPLHTICASTINPSTGSSNTFAFVGRLAQVESNQPPQTPNPASTAICAVDHVADLLPTQLVGGATLESRYGGAGTTAMSQATQSPMGVRAANSTANVVGKCYGEELMAFRIRKLRLTTNFEESFDYKNWSTLDLEAILGVTSDDNITPAGVLGE